MNDAMATASTPEPGGVSDPIDELERELAVLFRRARALSRVLAREVHPDVEPAAYGLLVQLDKTGGARLTDLAHFVGVGKPTLSRQVRLLERLGLVERATDEHDRRVLILRLTPEGAARVGAAREARRRRFRAMLSTWPADDVAMLGELLHRFNEVDRQTSGRHGES